MNSETIKLLQNKGASRVVLARECSLKDIKKISKNSPLELEVFIHGGMCMSISGKCVLSNYMTTRDANRGGCAQSCRWFYNMYDENKNKVDSNLFTFSSKDLQTLKYVKKLIKYNVASLKIEGRMKSEYYLATIISQYRKLIDDIYEGKANKCTDYEKETLKAESRPASCGFYKGKITTKQQIFDKTAEIPLQDFVARVIDYNQKTKIVTIEQRNNFTINEPFEVLSPNGVFKLEIKELWNKDNEKVEIARHAKEVLYFKSDIEFSEFDMFRQIKSKN
jgi:putative protease